MDSPKKIDVINWRASAPPIVPEVGAGRRFLPPTLIGIAGTVLLHAMLIQSVSYVSRGGKQEQPEAQESANSLPKLLADADYLVLVSLPATDKVGQEAAQTFVSSLPDVRKIKIKSRLDADSTAFLGLETLALSEEPATNPTASDSDGAEHARLFGIYTGQIQARIDRIWRRPRTPINESAADKKPTDTNESFQCEAQIVQDARGNVQEILLPRCNGSAAWQRSLVLAIQQASPLPAPPSFKVFTQSITLSFVGLPYVQGAPNEEYEIVPIARVDQ